MESEKRTNWDKGEAESAKRRTTDEIEENDEADEVETANDRENR